MARALPWTSRRSAAMLPTLVPPRTYSVNPARWFPSELSYVGLWRRFASERSVSRGVPAQTFATYVYRGLRDSFWLRHRRKQRQTGGRGRYGRLLLELWQVQVPSRTAVRTGDHKLQKPHRPYYML